MQFLNNLGIKLNLGVQNFFNSTKISSDVQTLQQVAERFEGLMQDILGPILIVIGAMAGIYLVYLGIMYAKAEDANKRKDIQGRLIGCAIGLVIIIVGITLVYAIEWETIYKNINTETTSSSGGSSGGYRPNTDEYVSIK